jgi:hypothetical protein
MVSRDKVSGWCNLERRPTKGVDVTLEINVEKFDALEYFSIPYILAHEIAVHAVQAIYPNDIQPRYPENCVFTEGVLDALIKEEAIVALRDPTVSPAEMRQARHIYEWAIDNVQIIRINGVCTLTEQSSKGAPPTGLANVYLLGKSLYRDMKAAFMIRFGGAGHSHMVHLLTTLNVLALTSEQRRYLASSLSSMVAVWEDPKGKRDRAEKVEPTPAGVALAGRISDYLDGYTENPQVASPQTLFGIFGEMPSRREVALRGEKWRRSRARSRAERTR